MADYSISPNMNLPVPTVGIAPGPGWATNIDASLGIIDSHNHSSGQGVQINPNGININSDLLFGNNNATVVRSVNFNAQTSTLSLSTDIGCIYVSGVDLYYNDENGNVIRITQSGSVSGSSGTITGLPSGTASAAYSAGTFTFQAATSTPATISVGPLILANSIANSKNITLSPNSSIAANYNFTFPAALPAALNYTTLDNSGNFSFNSSGATGSGAVVLAISPTIATPTISSPTISSPIISGTTTGIIEAATYSPTVSYTNAPTSVTQSWQYQRINNIVMVAGTIQATGAASVGSRLVSITLPISTSSLSGMGGIGLKIDNVGSTPATSPLNNSGNTLITPVGTGLVFVASTPGVVSITFSYVIS